jgi:hypothetical protein
MRWLILFSLFILGCSGYRFTQQDNPLSQYGIHSLSVPMFYNYSNLPDVSADFTREVYRLLTGFSGLKIRSGYSDSTDAVMIGIIKSPEKMVDTIKPAGISQAQGKTPLSVGAKRPNFNVPGASLITLMVQVIVIKHPTEEELALLKSGIGDQIIMKSKVILNETIPIQASMSREFLDDSGTQVMATQNLGVQRKTITSMSVQAAASIRDLIIYAF